MPDLGEVVKQTLAQKRAAESEGEHFSPPSTPSSSAIPQESSQQQTTTSTKPRTQSSSSTDRPPPITPPFATAPLSPYSDSTSVNNQEPNSPLGLDHPRPKHRTQASYDWFGDFKQQGGFEQPEGRKQSRQEGWESPNGGTLRGQNDAVRSESPTSTHHSDQHQPLSSPAPHASATTPLNGAPSNSRKRTETSGRGGSYPTTTSADSDEDGEGNSGGGGGENGSDLPKRTLRGAFTAEDFDRGQKKIQYGEGATGVTAGSKHSGAGSKMMRKVLHPTQSSSMGNEKKKSGGGLTRSSSAGEGTRSPGGTQMEPSHTIGDGRARSLRSRNEGDDGDWQEDEERDQFDTDAPAGPRSMSQSRRPTSGSGKKNSWAKLRTAAAANGGGGDHSGTSTPREHSDDEGAGGITERPGPGAKRPSNANARRGSAWEVVRKRLGGGDERKKQKARQGASLTGHELISVSVLDCSCPAQLLILPALFRNSLLVFSLSFSSRWPSWIEMNEEIIVSLFS